MPQLTHPTTCQQCGNAYQALHSETKKHGKHFCSRSCYDANRNPLGTLPCEHCGKSVNRKPSNLGKHAFCNKRCYGDWKKRPVMDRFQENYVIDSSGCWLWTGKLDPYGHFEIEGRSYRSHQASYILFKGPIPKRLCVCHKCDVPACVNPDHFFLGTRPENTQDMIAKGRDRRNEAHDPITGRFLPRQATTNPDTS